MSAIPENGVVILEGELSPVVLELFDAGAGLIVVRGLAASMAGSRSVASGDYSGLTTLLAEALRVQLGIPERARDLSPSYHVLRPGDVHQEPVRVGLTIITVLAGLHELKTGPNDFAVSLKHDDKTIMSLLRARLNSIVFDNETQLHPGDTAIIPDSALPYSF